MELKSIQRKSVIASVIASLLVIYFIQPLLNTLARIFLTILNLLFSSYLDRLYAEIAVGDINYSFIIFTYIHFVGIFAIVILALFLWNIIFPKGKLADQKKDGEEKEPPKLKVLLMITFLVFVVLSFLFGILDNYIRVKTSATFKQHLIVLSPHISEQTKEEISAKFASMENKQDYDKIVELLGDIAKEKEVLLPKNKLYPF